jgi:hypothetical protein
MKFVAVGIGFIAGIFFVVACQNVHMPNAHAAPADCAVWQYGNADKVEMQAVIDSNFVASELAPGWEPFAYSSTSGVLVRRCKP